MNMIKVLFIEDNEGTIKAITDYIEDHKSCWEYIIVGFKDAYEKIYEYDPDLIVMDIKDDAENLDAGDIIFKTIKERVFSPIIMFTALAPSLVSIFRDMEKDNPLFRGFDKRNEEQKVIETMEKWKPYLSAVAATRNLFAKSYRLSAKSLAYCFNFDDLDETVVQYMLSRRMQAAFSQVCVGHNPPAWIEYEYPPISKDLMVADVLRKVEEDMSSVGSADKYCVVLTPSCDLATRPNRQNENQDPDKIKKVLVARCESAGALLSEKPDPNLNSEKKKKMKDNINRIINTGYNYALVPMPELPGILPYMTINLKELDLLNMDQISVDESDIESKKYYRVASMSSPFRESTVWAHLINSCRPGLPERDRKPWASSIFDDWFNMC